MAILLVLSALTAQAPAAEQVSNELADVIVRAFTGAPGAREAVEDVGGRVTYDLPIIDGVSAEIPERELHRLGSRPEIMQVTPNASVAFNGAWEDPGIKHRIQKIVRSDKLWNQGITGQGVTVALLDTGVYAQHPDLQGPTGSRVVHCEDFSHERLTAANCADTFGHGTFMAGLIAGNGTSNDKYKGTAPGAKIVSVKAAGFDGSTDISTVLAGIQWTVAFRDVYGVDVLNLSLGSDSAQDYRLSPLNYAVERAWNSGLVVVVSAGNAGSDARTVMKPGDDPYVITVGAANDQGKLPIGDDTVAGFSSRGPTRSNGFAKPDIVSPGVHTVSLRSPGSAIDQQYGATAVVDGDYFRGSGTSMSTATTSGVVAQILQGNPLLTPNQVKYRLLETSRGISTTDPHAAGRGLIDAYAAANSLMLGSANQDIFPATGLGLLELDRGSIGVEVVTPIGPIDLMGEWSAQVDPDLQDPPANLAGLVPFVGLTYTLTGWDPPSFNGTTWKTEDWAGTTWKGTTWKATVWDGTTWKGTTWKNEDWEGIDPNAVDWDGTTWKGTTWKSYWYAAAWG